jgi:hypothetical protein
VNKSMEELQPWFAWRPVRVAQTGKLAWLRWLLRERMYAAELFTGKIWTLNTYYEPEAWISASRL